MIVGSQSDRDTALLRAARAALDDHLPPSARLERAEVNLERTPDQARYLYLRFTTPSGTKLEYWAHWGTETVIEAAARQITVKTLEP